MAFNFPSTVGHPIDGSLMHTVGDVRYIWDGSTWKSSSAIVGGSATVASIEYDPNRTCRIALLHYHDGEKRYILAPNTLSVGEILQSGQGSEIRVGNALPLRYIPVGTVVHKIELRPGGGGKLARRRLRQGSFLFQARFDPCLFDEVLAGQ